MRMPSFIESDGDGSQMNRSCYLSFPAWLLSPFWKQRDSQPRMTEEMCELFSPKGKNFSSTPGLILDKNATLGCDAVSQKAEIVAQRVDRFLTLILGTQELRINF
jgi:hypothetical protein